jgi:hypothetical protein
MDNDVMVEEGDEIVTSKTDPALLEAATQELEGNVFEAPYREAELPESLLGMETQMCARLGDWVPRPYPPPFSFQPTSLFRTARVSWALCAWLVGRLCAGV